MKKIIVLGMCFISFVLVVSVQAQYTEKWSIETKNRFLLDVGNTDGDPQFEILYGNRSDSLFLIDGLTGQMEWGYINTNIEFGYGGSYGYWESKVGPQLIDVDNDGVTNRDTKIGQLISRVNFNYFGIIQVISIKKISK